MSYLLVILLCLCLSGCGQDAPPAATAATNAEQAVPQPPTAWREGVTNMQAGNYAAAETHFTEAIKAAPQDYHAYADRGLVRALAERYEEARNDLIRASDLAPEMPAVEYNWAMYYKLQGQFDGALTHFQNVLKKEPKNAWTLYGIATIYADRGETEPALNYLERAIAADPAVADAARAQDHFRSFHENERFQKLVR
ncbi:TPR end-of-group domain-containing protein [Negativicoccus succinicivorans]|uniref:tetratricopeptide repeat protein n=1 Tax=Negativicoccus succinicivorans TaxID=620903 RepID=UPI002902A957|nr:tetratricopeptide repeat protein [Negativicoccus succinicivorans]MDU2417977.1 tetratricopeptide repeat protein [Negativicoccus succinicivorans]